MRDCQACVLMTLQGEEASVQLKNGGSPDANVGR